MLARILSLVLVVICNVFVYATDYKPVDPADMYQHDRWITKPVDRLKIFRAYVSSFDGIDDDNGDGKPDTLGVPNWVAYELRRFTGEIPSFGRPSPWITEESWHHASTAPDDDSYKNSGYSRGHLAMKTHAARLGANADWNTHTVVNAVPQFQAHNTGPWLKLENKTAEWADGYGVVWIITGPV